MHCKTQRNTLLHWCRRFRWESSLSNCALMGSQWWVRFIQNWVVSLRAAFASKHMCAAKAWIYANMLAPSTHLSLTINIRSRTWFLSWRCARACDTYQVLVIWSKKKKKIYEGLVPNFGAIWNCNKLRQSTCQHRVLSGQSSPRGAWAPSIGQLRLIVELCLLRVLWNGSVSKTK